MKRIIATAAVAATAAVPAKAEAKCQTLRCKERVARKQCSQKRVIPCIRRAAIHRHVDFHLLVRKARCESTLNPYATNGPHAGLFQFRVAYPSTWATTPYANRDPFSAKWNALAAAWMHQQGRGGEWACQ